MKLQKVGEVSTKKRGTAGNKLNNKKSSKMQIKQGREKNFMCRSSKNLY